MTKCRKKIWIDAQHYKVVDTWIRKMKLKCDETWKHNYKVLTFMASKEFHRLFLFPQVTVTHLCGINTNGLWAGKYFSGLDLKFLPIRLVWSVEMWRWARILNIGPVVNMIWKCSIVWLVKIKAEESKLDDFVIRNAMESWVSGKSLNFISIREKCQEEFRSVGSRSWDWRWRRGRMLQFELWN